MFFPRLRRQAKWVFVFLAVTFAASFVLFGVGTGFGGLQDILLQQRGTGAPTAEEAREDIRENPNNAQAHRDLSNALIAENDIDGAVPPLETYIELRPNDLDAKRELAGLHLRKAEQERVRAQIAQIQLQIEVPGQTFKPSPASKIGEAFANNPLEQALSQRWTEQLNDALTKMQNSFTSAVDVYKEIAKASPRDPEVQLELAQTAEAANDAETAIAAYKRFLELAPEDTRGEPVRERIELLESQMPTGAGG